MSRAPTKAELLQSLQRKQTHACALVWLIRQILPTAGWYFVESPRGFQGFLMRIDDDGDVTHYDMTIGSTERTKLLADLWRQESEGYYLTSLIDAMKAEQAWRARCFAPATIPAPPPDECLPPVLDPSEAR
jgi:coenzyme F420-reducing hydrogenase alpha subunit